MTGNYDVALKAEAKKVVRQFHRHSVDERVALASRLGGVLMPLVTLLGRPPDEDGGMAMGTQTTAIMLKNWCHDPFTSAPAAIRRIDEATSEAPEKAAAILGTAWTALVMLSETRGIPDPSWLPLMARFLKLSRAERGRVHDAVEMRLRAIERKGQRGK